MKIHVIDIYVGENEVGGESGNISPDTTTRHKRHLPFHRPMTPVDFSIKVCFHQYALYCQQQPFFLIHM